jgi:O-antigen ligase
VAFVLAFAYVILLGGTTLAETGHVLQLVTGLLGGALIVLAIIQMRGDGMDRVDLLAACALVVFAIASVLSSFPRQSLDAVLAATAFFAAFYLARGELKSATSRRYLITTMVVLSALITFVMFVQWVLPVLEWWGAVNWQTIPPLSFELSAYPWGHRHDVTLLLVMLYPAWWLGDPSPFRRIAATVVGAATVPIVLVDGSRTIWIAVALATVIVLVPSLVTRARASGVSLVLLAAAVVALFLAVASGIGGAVLQRAFSAESLEWRAAMWQRIVMDWPHHLITGNGPGSFPWVLQLTDYFDTNSWAPRHPDNAFVQAIAEAGLLGIASIVLIAAAILPAIIAGSSIGSRWALLVFAIATIGANPTAFAFLVVLALAWAAYGLPRQLAVEPRRQTRAAVLVRSGSLAAVAVIGLGFAAITIASFSYARAADDIASDAPSEALPDLDLAVALDPAMALYPRVRAAVQLRSSDEAAAIADLEATVRLNPADDLAWRMLGLARIGLGDDAGGAEAIASATALQRSDPTNLLLSAVNADESGDPEAATTFLAESVQAWPWIVFANGWHEVLPDGTSSAQIVDAALDRWASGAPTPALLQDQRVWLTSMTGSSDEAARSGAIAASASSPAVGAALFEAIQCISIDDNLASMAASEWRSTLYWWLRAAQGVTFHEPDPTALQVASLMAPVPPPHDAEIVLNPLNENGGGSVSADRFGYRRSPIEWSSGDVVLPSPGGGLAAWLYSPRGAAESARLLERLPQCAPAS